MNKQHMGESLETLNIAQSINDPFPSLLLSLITLYGCPKSCFPKYFYVVFLTGQEVSCYMFSMYFHLIVSRLRVKSG